MICSAGLGRLLLMTSTGVDILQIPPSGDVERTTIVTLNKGTPRGEISIITPYNIDTCFVADGELFADPKIFLVADGLSVWECSQEATSRHSER